MTLPSFAAPPRIQPETTQRRPEHPAARLVPDWHSRYQARRDRQRSDPKLFRFLVGMGVAGVFGAIILLSFFLLQDLKQKDGLRAEAASIRAASTMRSVIEETKALVFSLAPTLDGYSVDPAVMSAATRRQLRRDVFSALDDSPVVGLVMINSRGDVVFEIGDPGHADVSDWARRPLEPGARLLEEKITFLRPEPGQDVRALFALSGNEHAIVTIFDADFLTHMLTPPKAQGSAYLYDHAGRVLAASRTAGSSAYVVADTVPTPELSSADDRVAHLISGGEAQAKAPSHSRAVGVSGLRVAAMVPPITISRFFRESGHLLAAAVGIALLTVGLLIYVIQAEWKRHDRRSNLDEDTVARSEIAADIMGAGIIDWRVSDAAVSYSEGWQRLFSAATPIGDEEIFDWIEKLHPDSRPAARENYQALIDGHLLEIDHKIRVRCQDDHYITVHERGRSRTNARGEPSRVVLVQRKTSD